MRRLLCRSVALWALAVLVLLAGLFVISLYWFGPPYPPDRSGIDPRGNDPLHLTFPPSDGWSAKIITEAEEHARDAGLEAIVVLHQGRLVAEWGDTDRVTRIHSVRKSILSLLIGIAVDRGMIDLDETLETLGIDDKAGLTKGEKQANIRDLLTCRSGVYLPAVGETASMARLRPEREEHAPGEYWYYNNWDFNVLGVIFERKTGISIREAMEEWLAKPLEMQDFHPDHVFYWRTQKSNHPMYQIAMSARDMARIGQLVTDNGRWKGKQVVSVEWIKESTGPQCKTGPRNNSYYGYSWWVPWSSQVQASGLGGQIIQIDTQLDLVVVTMNFSGSNPITGAWWLHFGKHMSAAELRELIRLIKLAGSLGEVDSVFARLIAAGEIEGAIAHFRSVRSRNPDAFMFTEDQLNQIGYDVWENGYIEGAIELFRLNVELFPGIANTHDSLAEALLDFGDRTGAKKEYERALAIDPWSETAARALAILNDDD